MAKIGISVKIDLNKIDESRVFQGKNGARYLDLTTFIDTEKESQYGDHGFVSQATTKDEREAKVQTPILGNTKVFYTDIQGGVQQFKQGAHPQHQAPVFTPQPTVETFSQNGDGTIEDAPF
jgi:hypothetical protein